MPMHKRQAAKENKVVPVLNHAPVLRQSDIMNLVEAKMLGSRYQALATTHNKRDLEEENAYEYEYGYSLTRILHSQARVYNGA